MALAEKKKPKGSTPGRPKRKGNQFWDIGKVGRKTGITLEDKGIRDEHGLEPMEHIFSSPVRKVDGAEDSGDDLMQQSSGPDVDMTLNFRKTPRLPPPRASTPRHTHIGSPKRMSTGRPASQRPSTRPDEDASPTRPRTQPPANRVLDFGADKVQTSIESPSPFKPRHALRRSTTRQDPFDSPSRAADPIAEEEEEVAGDENDMPPIDDEPILLDDDDYYDAMPQEPSVQIEEVHVGDAHDSPSKPATTRSRRSDASINRSLLEQSPNASRTGSGKKRDRSLLEDDQAEPDQSLADSQLGENGPASKKRRGRPSKDQEVIVHHRNGKDETIDPALLAQGDTYEVDTSLEAALAKDTKGKGKKGKVLKKKAPKAVKINESPSKLRNERSGSRQGSAGPTTNYHLRATTPFEDAGERVSRFGRNLIQPLKFWANETRIYKYGEIEGIVRAEEVEKPKRNVPKRKKKRGNKLDAIEEEEDETDESVAPDEWEDEVGVIAGMVASWDPETQMGNAEDLIREDLAFASSSIVTREVAGSDFRYAKVMTLPFFGSGVVELPPGGVKRVKNSRKMHMCFFVHEGKVMVEIGAAGVKDVTQFAISKGGVWVVPRGNNYAITNESETKTARVFFAQGCEVNAFANAVQ